MPKGLSVEELRENVYYAPGTGLFTWKKKAQGRRIGGRAGNVNKASGYVNIYVNGEAIQGSDAAWALFTGSWPENIIDHIDRNPSNNRISNLRPATNAQNGWNRGKQKNNTSGFKGVYRDTAIKKGKWYAIIIINSVRIRLGRFDTPEEAHESYKKAAAFYHGEFYTDTNIARGE